MALKRFTQISDDQIRNASIASLADKPNTSSNYGTGGLSAAELKARFDAFPKLVQEKIAEIVSTLASTEAGQYIALPSNKTGKDNLYDFVALFTDADGWKETIADFTYIMFREHSTSLSQVVSVMDNQLESTSMFLDSVSTNVNSLQDEVATFSDKLQKGETALTKATAVEKRVTNLESQVNKDLIVTDSSVAYAKEVPARSAPYAEITKFGGMTYKTKNLFNPQWLLDADKDVRLTADGFYYGSVGWYYGAYGQPPAQLPIYNFKSNTSYTIRFEGYNETVNDDTFAFKISYTDGSYIYSPFMNGTVNAKYSCETDGSKTIDNITILYNHGDMIYLRNILIAEGTDIPYEPYFEGLRHTKPTAFKSIGANLFNVDESVLGKNYGGETGIGFRAVSVILPYKYPMYIKANGSYNIRFEVDYLTKNEYSYDAVLANSGWITDTEMHTLPYYEHAKYIVILFDAIDVNRVLTKADIEAMQLQISYGDFDSYSPYEETTLSIPTEVQKLPDWGVGYKRAYNYVDWDAKKYHKRATKGIISNVFKTSGVYGNIHYFGFSKPTNFDGYNDTSRSFIIEGFETRSSSGDWNNVAWIGTATGEASYTDMWVGFPAGTTLEEAKAALEGKEWIYVLKNEEVADIPDLPDDNLIPVEGGGTITAVNDYNYDVPSEITYQLRSAT